MLLFIVAAAGCSTGTDTTSPRLAAPAPSLSAVGTQGQGQRVTGSATIILPAFGNALERYSISAIRENGRVKGEFEEFSGQEGGQRIHADVYCFSVTGNTARLAARIDQTNVSFGPKGSYVIWTVVDNGQGARTAPDETTDIFFGGTQAIADFHCNTGINLAPFFPSMRGNLHVE
jgi:hypothetical protein